MNIDGLRAIGWRDWLAGHGRRRILVCFRDKTTARTRHRTRTVMALEISPRVAHRVPHA